MGENIGNFSEKDKVKETATKGVVTVVSTDNYTVNQEENDWAVTPTSNQNVR